MADSQTPDPNMYTKMMALTSTFHNDVYPALQAAQSTATGKYILITGASRGIGMHMAKAFAAAKAAGIAICARKASSLESVTAELKSINPSVNVLAQACDVTQSSQVAAFFHAAKEQFGKLDVVIANVGIANDDGMHGMCEHDVDKWWEIMSVNTRGTRLTVHHYVQTFGPAPTGTVILVTSGAGAIVIPGLSAYSLSKYTMTRMVEILDVEYPSLKVFALDPGVVKGLATLDGLAPFAVVEPGLVGAFAVWLASGKGEGCKGGYAHVTWDVEELEKYSEEISSKGLVKSKFLGGILGQQGGALGK